MPSVISEDVRINGDVVGQGDIQVEGQVEGTVECEVLVIGERGRVEAKVTAEEVQISGTFRGEIKAGNVALSASADVSGDLYIRETLSIDKGAFFEGRTERTKTSNVTKLESGKEAEPKDSVAETGTSG